MTDKTREVYKESGHRLTELNPFVEMPRMRIDAVNRLNELIKRDNAIAPIRKEYEIDGETKYSYECPICKMTVGYSVVHNFCYDCGQRIDTENFQL